MQDLQEVSATLQRLFPDNVQRGKVRSTLVGLSDRDLGVLFGDTDDAVKEALLQQLAVPAAAGAAGASEEAWIQATIKRRCPCSSKYAAHLSTLDCNNQVIKEAATVIDLEYIATFAHDSHLEWKVGQPQQVSLHAGDADKRRVVTAKVVLIDFASDIAILKVDEKLPEAPVLDAAVSPGERYYLHGQSTQAQADSSSISHGVIAATELDAHSHIRGDMPSGRGDSGGGCFSLETGKLIAINVGRDDIAHKAVLVPSAVIQHMLAQLKSPTMEHTWS